MKYLEILKARYEAQRHGVRILRTDTIIRFFSGGFIIQDKNGRQYRYKPKETLRIDGEYKLLSLVGVIRACILRSVLI